jgi:hypothetical protein
VSHLGGERKGHKARSEVIPGAFTFLPATL